MQNDLFGNPQCTKGWESRCAYAHCKNCRCGCGGLNHGKLRQSGEEKSNEKKIMFYILKKEKVADIKVGEKVMVLADFSGIKAGEKGEISENYKHGVFVKWDLGDTFNHPRGDGFGEDELEYLAFATLKHPTKAK